MSGAKRFEETQQDESQTEASDSSDGERRSEPDSKARDRRVIARFNAPQMRLYGRQIHRLCVIWVGFSVAYVAALGAIYATRGVHEVTRTVFGAVVVAAIAFCVHRVGRSARSYLENESQARVATLIERIFMLMLVLLVLTVILGTVHVITLI